MAAAKPTAAELSSEGEEGGARRHINDWREKLGRECMQHKRPASITTPRPTGRCTEGQ